MMHFNNICTIVSSELIVFELRIGYFFMKVIDIGVKVMSCVLPYLAVGTFFFVYPLLSVEGFNHIVVLWLFVGITHF